MAEILITLTIIGVIAALTIPNLIANHQKIVLKTQFFKSYSTIQNALTTINSEQDFYSEIIDAAYTTVNGTTNGNEAANITLKPILMSKLKVSKDGNKNDFVNNFTAAYKNFDNSRSSINWGNLGQFELEDKSTIYTECSYWCKRGIYIFVDVNGYKTKPNRNGVDLFCFMYDNQNKLIPCTNWGETCNKSTEAAARGFDCTKQAITDSNYFKNLKL